MTLLDQWSDFLVPDDLVSFSDGARHLVTNPQIAAFCALDDGQFSVLCDLARRRPSPTGDATTMARAERTLGVLVLNWLVYLPGRQPVLREPDTSLKLMYYAITDGCNLRCPYCYASSTRRLPGELEPHESLDLIRQAAEMGTTCVIFTGGEPMLRRDLFTAADLVRDLGMAANIITNATRIPTPEVAARVARTFDQVTISIDGGTAELHERTRGSGTFAKTVAALRLLNEQGVEPIINHVVTEDNVDHLDSVGRLFEDIRVRQVRLMHHSKLGRGIHDGIDFGWQEYQRVNTFTWTNPLAHNLLPDGPLARKPCSIRGNCGMGGTEIYVNSLGDVYPCKLVTGPEHLAGNVRQASLHEIFDRPVLAELRGSSVFQGDNLTDCRKCYIRAACGGGCRAYHMAQSGDIRRNARSFCRILRHQMVTSMWVSVGASAQTLTNAGDAPFTPVLVKDATVHPVHEDWRRQPTRVLPIVGVS